jgi:lysophospholipase L1-like esterase
VEKHRLWRLRIIMIGLIAAILVLGLTRCVGTTGAAELPGPVTYYLALGGSASVGFQPTVSRPDGQPTDDGYANDLLSIERSRWQNLQLVQFGCPGETTDSFWSGGDRCHTGQSQLNEAVAFLHTHPNTVLTTIDLGFNDITRCLAFKVVNQACVVQRLNVVNQQLPPILAALRAAGRPTMRIVGIGHYDPFLGDFLQGEAARDFSQATLEVIDELHDTLHSIYGAAGVPMADVGRAFGIDRTDPTILTGVGIVPRNVARTCQLTWDCTTEPRDAKQHPNGVGYQVIAQLIAQTLATAVPA